MTDEVNCRRRQQIVSNALHELSAADLDQGRADVSSVRDQLHYLLAVIVGEENGSRLSQLNFGTIVAKSIEPAERRMVDALHDASAIATIMAREQGRSP